MNNLDIFWSYQEVYYNFRCDIAGTGNRSASQNWLVIIVLIEVSLCYKEVDIEAWSLRFQYRYDTIQ